MLKRVFIFLLSFFFFIGGTLAPVEAASVVAAELINVDDSGISVTSIDTENGSESTTFTTIIFYNSSGSQISSLSNISTYTQITVPADTAYMALYFSLNAYSFNGISTVTLSSRSYAGYNIVKVDLFFRANGSEGYTSQPSTQIFDKALTDAFQFEMYYSNTNYMVLDCYFDKVTSSSVTMYTPNITFSTGSSDDLEETNNLISTGNGLLSNIWSSITALPQQIINLFISAMQSLFIPSDDYFTTKFNELYVLFDEKLGFLMYPSEVFSSFVDALQASSNGFTIEFPAFSIDVGGASYQVWDDYTFNFDDIKNNFPEIFSAAEIIFTVILCGYSINLIITYYDVVVWGSSSTALVDQGDRDDY